MCVVPCASETAAKASTETEACNIMMRLSLNECVVEKEGKRRRKESCEKDRDGKGRRKKEEEKRALDER